MRIRLTAIFLLLLALSSCMNGDEKEIVGRYKVNEYSLEDSNTMADLPVLKLNDDKTFTVSYSDHEIAGKWSAYDDGDLYLVYFSDDDKFVNGQVFSKSEVFIDMSAPTIHDYFPRFKSIMFKRVE